MAEKTKSLELKVGIFAFAGLLILSWFIFRIGDVKLTAHGYHVRVLFGFANGIKIGAPVRIAGVDKGEVKEIRLTHNTDGKPEVFIRVWVDGDTLIPVDSRAWVNTLGLLGEKYLEIIPGKDYNKVLVNDSLLVGEDPTSVQEVTDLAKDIALQVKETLDTLDSVLNDIHEGRGTVGKLFTDDRLYTDIEEMFADLKLHTRGNCSTGPKKPDSLNISGSRTQLSNDCLRLPNQNLRSSARPAGSVLRNGSVVVRTVQAGIPSSRKKQ